jgi:hypothetical protein
VAEELTQAYPDGVWLVELAAVGDPALVPQAIATGLGIREQPGRDLQNTLIDVLRPRLALLLLDNCEHLVAACASVAERLLRACPGLTLLTTSREPLAVAGETLWRVPPLTVPALQDAVMGEDAMQSVLVGGGSLRAAHAAPRSRSPIRTAAVADLPPTGQCRSQSSWPPRACAAWRPSSRGALDHLRLLTGQSDRPAPPQTLRASRLATLLSSRAHPVRRLVVCPVAGPDAAERCSGVSRRAQPVGPRTLDLLFNWSIAR